MVLDSILPDILMDEFQFYHGFNQNIVISFWVENLGFINLFFEQLENTLSALNLKLPLIILEGGYLLCFVKGKTLVLKPNFRLVGCHRFKDV